MSSPALPPKAFLDACQGLTTRLRILKRTAQQARDRGDEEMAFNLAEVFDASDDAALEAFERELAALLGQQPLPYGVAS